MGSLATLTSLPNLHPAVVHFPIALLVCALGFDVASFSLPRLRWLDRTAAALFLLGALVAWAAVLTGERAADSLVAVPPQVQPFINEHQEWAERTAWIFSVIAIVRLVVAWADRAAARARRLPIRGALLLVAVAGQWLLLGTADRGGSLVYVHGLAVTRPLPPAPAAEPAPAIAGSSETRLTRADGRVLWKPAPGDAAALGTVVELVPGSATVSVIPETEAKVPAGIGLEVSGRLLLVLPDEFGDVQVEAEMDASGFHGVLGVVHHVHAMDDAGAFEVSTEGRAALVTEAPGSRTTLDEAHRPLPEAAFTVAVSAAGGHFKGIVDGVTVVHGHTEAMAPGRVGLLLDGSGVVRVHSLSATPLGEGL